MEKIINIDAREVKLKVNGGFLIQYKIKYGRDALKDIIKMLDGLNLNSIDKSDDLNMQVSIMQKIDLDLFYRMLHMMAKTANPDIEEDYVKWCSSFDNLPVFDLINDLVELLMSSMTSSYQKKTM